MDKFENALLKQLDGQKTSRDCMVCNRKTDFIFNKDGTITCTKCKTKIKVDLTDAVKGLKKLGVSVD
ncbi:hypothetical protein [Desulfosporosinus youngiae]|uniref:Uncharacterized protein n=1 Tax=Desulfosporosinus youngiae DSM 17734 TaxID=768710 RepID=H5Y592_9FIRM|nr:hypothetical protein [Desulfosporosinus youngiae]EHQ90196.1 hypothetical protein DesyoDRAFT_3162 [Desulfosporosinus youngiae DSM 17734]